MEFWNRAASVQLGPYKYTLDGMEFSFEVPFEDSDELTTATIEIRNLSANTRNSIQKNHVVIINAGYESDMGVIFVGQVAGMSHKREDTGWTTKITAAEVLEQWITSEINKTYTTDMYADEIVTDLLNVFGVEVGTFDLAVNKQYPRGKVCSGKTKDVLTNIVTGDCRSRFLIRNGQVIINNPEDGVNKGFLLSPATGLLRSEEDMQITAIETELTSQDSYDQKDEDSALKKRKCFLNYHLGPSDIIMITSASLNGRFQVVRGRHVGSRSGDWYTEVEVSPI